MERMSGLPCVGRRGFIGGLAAAAACPVLADGEKPLFKVGLVTDTHVRKTRKSCERVELAYQLFKKKVNSQTRDHHHPNTKSKQRCHIKRKLQAKMTDEHRCKNPQQNSSKQNPVAY